LQLEHPEATIELARAYCGSPAPPKGIAAPPPRPWPPRDQVHGRDALSIEVAGQPYGEDVDLGSAVDHMDDDFDTLPAECRAAGIEFWEFLADLGWEDTDGSDIVLQFPSIVLVRALASLDLSDRARWADLRAMLQRAQALGLPETVSIKRYWGW